MSTSTESHSDRVTCQSPRCDEQGHKWEFRDRQYCSTECFYVGEGADVFANILKNPRICPTCFRQVKTIDRPNDDELESIGVPKTVRDIFMGYQDPTEATETSEYCETPAENSAKRKRRPTWGCQCGTLDHRSRSEGIERAEGVTVIRNLLRVLLSAQERGAIDADVSEAAFFAALRERGRDYEYAIGRALYGGPA